MDVIIINGPNLNLLGKREPEVYGNFSFADFMPELEKGFPGINIIYRQSNHEGVIIDWLQEFGFKHCGIILNPGAYTHTSIAIGDAIRAIDTAVVEVHLSDPDSREKFRKVNFIRDHCVFSIKGKGLEGYTLAVEYFINQWSSKGAG